MSNSSSGYCRIPGEEGTALLITLIALSLFSLLGLFMMFNAAAGLQISDNGESQVQASYAALSGLSHARALLRGLSFNDLLRGPDGAWNQSPSYTVQARAFAFRNPFSLTIAQSLDVTDPSSAVFGLPDDGLINTGFYGSANGIALIPISGIAHTAPNPYGPGTIVTSRYFVKVSDNSGDASEIAGDPDNDPFFDGDGIIIVRSLGVAGTQPDATGTIRRNNSVTVFEARMKRLFAFDLGPALVIHGVQVDPFFDGPYEISGGEFPAIGTIDADLNDAFSPDQKIRAAPLGGGIVQGGNLPDPSVQDLSAQVASNPGKSLLLKPDYLWSFVRSVAPRVADSYFNGDRDWSGANAPYIGSYDLTKPPNAPGQDPKIIAVNGNLRLTGSLSGGGLLIVTGDFSCSGTLLFNGLILAIGSGRLLISGSGTEISGGVYLSNIKNEGGEIKFGTAAFSISGANKITRNKESVRMALGLLPASQIGFREIAGSDP